MALDLKKGYQQITVTKEARQYLGATLGGETVASAVLPFGLSLSSYVSTRVTNRLARKICKKFQPHAAVYIDDFLLGAEDRDSLERGLDGIRKMFERLGVVWRTGCTGPLGEGGISRFVVGCEREICECHSPGRKEYMRSIGNLLRTGQTQRTWK